MKTNLMLNNMGGNHMKARGIVSMELTVGSKLLATTFFIIEMHGNNSVILGHYWIYTNHWIPSTLHQFLMQLTDIEIEVVHAFASAYMALADTTADCQLGCTQCLSGKDLIGYDFLSISMEGFMPVCVKPASEARLGNVVFQ
jgi:hypothetical protein